MYLTIKTTSNDMKTLKNISNILLNNNFSPCIHIIENVATRYIWKNQLTKTVESILEIKTSEKHKQKICDIIRREHNYNNPEIICFNIEIIDKKYKEWFEECIN